MPKKTTKTTLKKGTRNAITRAIPWQDKFIAALENRGIVQDAAKAARINRTTAYSERNKNPEFAERWQAALEKAADTMEGEAFRRAVKGVRKPVYQGGKLVGHVQEYSDVLLIFMLKAIRPEKYRERFEHKHEGKDGKELFPVGDIVAALMQAERDLKLLDKVGGGDAG